jgi:chaperone required for assembly of F1-ATPase
MPSAKDPLRGPRRFYSDVTVERVANGFAPRLDGRAPKSPKANPLVLPTAPLAELIAQEWRAQGDVIDYNGMPATRLAHTALDVVPGARAATLEGVTRYASADLLCYFADHPTNLLHRQQQVWGPLLDWVKESHGLAFVRATGIVHVEQPPQTAARLTALLEPLDDFALAGLAFAAALFGSAILAVALRDQRIKAEGAMAAARLDEIFQEEQWGVDAESEIKADAMAVDAVMVERWFAALVR